MRWAAVRVAVVPLLLPTLLAGQQAVDSVHLRFDWPIGMTAIVEQEWMRISETPAKRDSTSLGSSYRLRVREHARGRLVTADSFRVAAIAGLPPAAARSSEVERVVSLLGSMQPSFVVSSDGEFLELAELDKMKSAMDSFMTSMMPQVGDAPPEFRQFMERLTSAEVLTTQAAEQWNSVVGTWVGADWVIGEAYGTSSEQELPLLPGVRVPMEFEFSAAERRPCTAHGRDSACVLLRMYSAPDTVALRTLVGELVKQMGVNAGDLADALAGMRMESTIELLIEPESLRPHRVTQTKVVVVPGPGGSASAPANRRLDVRRAVYRYDL